MSFDFHFNCSEITSPAKWER